MPDSFSTVAHSKKPVRMQDLAKALGVSIGTIDRALNEKPGVSPMTRQRILSMARTMGYRPNLAARFLSARKELRLAVNLPRLSCVFFDEVWTGFAAAASESVPGNRVAVIPRRYPNLWEAEAEAFSAALNDDVQAIIVSPENPRKLKSLIREAAQRGVPVLCLTTDAPGTERLCCISSDYFMSGCMAAELMGHFLGGEGNVMLVSASLDIVDNEEKVRGFRHCAETLFPGLHVAAVIQDNDNEEESYHRCREALTSNPLIRGVYVATGNSLPVLRLLSELGLEGELKVIATDLFPGLVPMLRSGALAATIHQRPLSLGRIAFETAYRFLTGDVCPPAIIRLAPRILLRSNLKGFLDRGEPVRQGQKS